MKQSGAEADPQQVIDRKRRSILVKAAAQSWLCFHCDLPMVPEQVTRDHLVPRSKGGKGGGNIVAACFNCNKRKGDRAAVPNGYLSKKRQMHFRGLGVSCNKPRGEWRDLMPNFGKGPSGSVSLWAPQYGIV